MKKIIEIRNSQPKRLRINYEITDVCNYKCWYCFPGSNAGTVRWPDHNTVKHNLTTLINYYVDNGIVDDVTLSFLGGEPTLWPEFGDVIEHVSKNTTAKIYVITNASRTLDWWERYGDYFDNVTISVHHEKANLEQIEGVCNILYKKDTSFYTDVLMDHTHWQKCVDIVNQLTASELGFLVIAKPVIVENNVHYDVQQRSYLKDTVKRMPSAELIKKHSALISLVPDLTAVFDDGQTYETKDENYFVMNKLNEFFGWSCNLGINLVYINKYGELSGSCKQKLYGMDEYFNLNDANFKEKFSPNLTPVICKQLMCLCPGEIALAKKK
jgi:organic radical activating enzyme